MFCVKDSNSVKAEEFLETDKLASLSEVDAYNLVQSYKIYASALELEALDAGASLNLALSLKIFAEAEAEEAADVAEASKFTGSNASSLAKQIYAESLLAESIRRTEDYNLLLALKIFADAEAELASNSAELLELSYLSRYLPKYIYSF